MKTERELFEEVFKTLSHTFNESLYMIPNTDRYYSSIAQASWEAWQASAQREGYKLVPVEPTERMLDAARCRQWDDLSSPLEDMDMLKYKAMIGVVD